MMKNNNASIVWFEEVDKSSIPLVGGKGANLGEMLGAKLPIPYGFIVTSKAYKAFVQENDLNDVISQHTKDLDYSDQKALSLAVSPMPTKVDDDRIFGLRC